MMVLSAFWIFSIRRIPRIVPKNPLSGVDENEAKTGDDEPDQPKIFLDPAASFGTKSGSKFC